MCIHLCIKQSQPVATFRSNILDVAKSSMGQKTEYLVKYSVAPPPSRDYYGLKILEDEVTLHLWKISHGPHKAPIVHLAKLSEFDQQKSLQDEIRRGFGEHLLKYVRNIAGGDRYTLLTLPKSLIGRISSYLKSTDIVKLSSLSHVAYEVFNTDSIWQILYTRDQSTRIGIADREKAKFCGWKQLYKNKQMQISMRHQRNFGIQSSIKYASDAKANKSSLKPISGASKSISKTTSVMNIAAKKRQEIPTVDLVTTPLFKTTSDTQPRSSVNTNNKKPLSQKRNMNSTIKVNQKNVKKGDHTEESRLPAKTGPKRETGNAFDFDKELFDKQQRKFENYSNNINNIGMKSQKGKRELVPRGVSLPKGTGNVKSSSGLTQSTHSKARSKAKLKTNKIPESTSEINDKAHLNIDKALYDNPFVHGNFDLADLIEASLKNIRNPRSIFDYDFSYLQQSNATRNALPIGNKATTIDKQKERKLARRNPLDYLSDKITRDDGFLEKLSERSEPFSETSNDSLTKNTRLLPNENKKSLSMSEKYMRARAELQKPTSSKRKNDPIFIDDQVDTNLHADFQEKCHNPKKFGDSDEKIFIPKGTLRTSNLMKTNSLSSRQRATEKNSRAILRNRFESMKLTDEIEGNRLIK